ncbi:MAG: hypothetical protein CMJ64_18380 [Planctomycetaceae bacterium]|nr:hypothetical protein [Planctomycetaceae bacterium]
MDFDERLQKAIQRGKHRGDRAEREAAAQAMSEDDLKRLHNQYRLELSDQIEKCLGNLPHHFPGFSYETIFGERGWGAACSRDDIRMQGGRRNNDYSRLAMTIRPFTEYHIVELTSKGTIRNRELFNRSYYEKIEDADCAKFSELIDVWVLEYAEQYAAKS